MARAPKWSGQIINTRDDHSSDFHAGQRHTIWQGQLHIYAKRFRAAPLQVKVRDDANHHGAYGGRTLRLGAKLPRDTRHQKYPKSIFRKPDLASHKRLADEAAANRKNGTLAARLVVERGGYAVTQVRFLKGN